jgi:transposase
MKTLSIDLRERILKAYDRGDTTREDVAARFDVSLGMVKKLLQQRRNTGDIAPRHHRSGRKPMILDKHKRQLKRLIDKRPDMTLNELRDALELDCSLTALHKALDKMGLTLKKRRSTPLN